MQSHFDSDFQQKQFIERLKRKAEHTRTAGNSQITGGRDGEAILSEWTHDGISVRELPPDDLGILRISIGGGPGTPVNVNYCVYRGDHAQCIDLLRKALAAMEARG